MDTMRQQSNSVDSGIANGLDTIENGESNYGDEIYVKQSLAAKSNETPIGGTHESNNIANNQQKASGETVLSSTRNEQSAIEIAISTGDDSQQPQAHNCNINYTNESSICKGNVSVNVNSNGHNSAHAGCNGHAIIDVNATHTGNDHSKVTIRALPEQLPYSQTQSSAPHKNTHKFDNDGGDSDGIGNGGVNTNVTAAAAATNNDNDVVDVSSTASGPVVEESNRKQHKLSNQIVVLLRRSKPIALVVINSVLAVLITTSLCISMGLDYTVPAIVVGLIAVVASSGLWYWLYIAAVTAPRDIRALYRYIKLLSLVRRCQRKNVAVCDLFHHYVAKHPQKPCIIYDGQEWTFREVNEFSNRIANLFQQHGYKKGDVVGLFMDNRPEFVGTWLGLSKIGVIVPLINTNQRQASLIHSIEIAKCQALIYGESLASAVSEVSEKLNANSSTAWYQYNDDDAEITDKSIKNLKSLLADTAKTDVVSNSSNDTHHNQLLYIYTSGTTGLPKAAVITHSRYIFIAAGIHYMANFQPDDIFYTPLPLYHTAGGVMSIGQALLFGSTVVIRKKFSASGYFPDCQKYKCTVAQYIGEMCRYILATPPNAADTNHNLRIIFGNGLRPQIWPQFIKRFQIPHVAEFYGATEGNANIVNINNVVGAIGFVSRIIPSVYPISVIKADPDSGEPIRDNNGLCQLCKPHEPGVFVGKIMPGNPSRAFLGYVDKAASSKKIVKDVFKKGDQAFLSGDLLVSDEYGNLYFKDRTGDTFRWKGENVSTSEVEAQVSNVAGYRDTVVYGVEIPNTEGRAGMAAILDVDQTIDLDALGTGLKAVLPAYARPQFIRLLSKVDMTGTFKLKKIDLQKEGFNPSKIGDSLYYLSANGKYSKLDKAVYEQILNGAVRF